MWSALTCAAVTAVARREAAVAVGERAVAAARSAWQTGRDLAARQPLYGLACELISATRALRLQARVPGGALRRAFDLADSAMERTAADRPLNSYLSAAEAALPGIAGSCPGQEQAGERWLAGRSRR